MVHPKRTMSKFQDVQMSKGSDGPKVSQRVSLSDGQNNRKKSLLSSHKYSEITKAHVRVHDT